MAVIYARLKGQYKFKYQVVNIKWKHKLFPIDISNSGHNTEIDLMIYKNHYVLIKKLNILFW